MLKKVDPTAFANDLTSFKKTLVVSSSDRYVGAEDPKLREKVSELYGTIATFAGRPSNAQLTNLDALKNSVTEATATLEQMKSRLAIIEAAAQKAKTEGITPVKFPTWEEFKAE